MDFLTDWSALSSTGLVGTVLSFLDSAGSWAEAVAKLIGLVA